jgi:hypothetical protein
MQHYVTLRNTMILTAIATRRRSMQQGRDDDAKRRIETKRATLQDAMQQDYGYGNERMA